ncbi:BREX system P-loop protein BrxC [Methanofollis formosanus]|uniref:BREX system P-loop protein BrxC n=2 Tax=Methanofollis formosanus TaxID=299308 RepID=A0A8G1A3A5_9EURY|nr:BREX system P-loop protein BrxC [Methanofollis formosanus]
MPNYSSILNREVFDDDPKTYTLPNDGVAKVGPLPENREDKQWVVARYELEHFVCEGSYHDGLRRILRSYLQNLDHPSQPAAWVSGFFGSGKSHLVRVLEFLWSDLNFADGATARGICNLQPDIVEALKELTTEARRAGGIWSAAGTLSNGDSDDPRLAVLQVVLRSAGLPDNPDIARVHLWLVQEGIYDELYEKLRELGKEKDMGRPFVSEYFAHALLELKPKFADSTTQATEFLSNQFITNRQMTNPELIGLMKDIFLLKGSIEGQIPLVLLVLDEVQQYLMIGESNKQLLAFQEIIEDCCKCFEGKLLIVATGQEALQANVLLQRLQGRFSVRVQLESKDVDVVLRQTVLRKKESMKKPLQEVFDQVNGEISRHLGGTKLAHQMEDNKALILDYPLLPTRKRLWDRILHAVDTGGMSTQLRTQLRLAYDGAQNAASKPIGTVIPADFIFNQLNTYLIRNGLLAAEINEMIGKENDGTSDGELRSRICALIFLIQHIDDSFGVRANEQTLSDLLVTDLVAGSDPLRKKVPKLLEDLNDRCVISDVGDRVYHIQTKEGKAWDSDYRTKIAHYKADDSKIMFKRDELLGHAIEKELRGLSLVQGKSKTPRKIDLTIFGPTKPAIGTDAPLWIRHGWEAQESQVRLEAQEEGNESPLVMIYLPRMHHNEIKNEIAGMLAATEIIQSRPTPTTSEGHQARTNIEAKCKSHQTKIERYIGSILKNTKMYPGGGIPVDCPDLPKAVHDAALNSMLRMFPRFNEADAVGWDRVITRVKADVKSPLEAIGFSKATEEHPVCKEILHQLHSGPKTGNEMRKVLEGPPFGWPKDAVDGALIALCASEHLSGTLQRKQITAKEMDRKNLGKMEFHTETVVLSVDDKLLLRALCTDLSIPTEGIAWVESASSVLDVVSRLAEKSGGEAPRPELQTPGYLADLRSLSGNQLVKEIVANQSAIKSDVKNLKQKSQQIVERIPAWRQLTVLIDYAEGLDILNEVLEQYNAIFEQRSLLSDPDPVPPLLMKVRNGLREALTKGAKQVRSAQESALTELKKDKLWQQLSESQQVDLQIRYNLIIQSPLSLKNDDEIITQIKKTPLISFSQTARLIEQSLPDIRAEMAKMLEPKTVEVLLSSGAIVRTEEELDSYLADLKERAMSEIGKGNPVMLK